jgi:hypothetical protein
LELKTVLLRKEKAILNKGKDAGRVRQAEQDKGVGPDSLANNKKRIVKKRPKELWPKRKSRQ